MESSYDVLKFIAGLIKDFLPLIGVMVGAWLHYFLSRHTEAKRQERLRAIDSYTDYLRSIGEMETSIKIGDPVRRAEVTARAIAAKVKVCTYGSPEVVDALSKFEGNREAGLTPEKRKHLVAFLEAVRKDCGSSNALATARDVEAILFH